MVIRFGPGRSIVRDWRVWSLALIAAVACIVGARGQNLDEGKSGPQLFALDCVACHRSPQGLVKSYNSFTLTSFLRQHYTSSSGSAGVLAAYLTSAANTRPAPKKDAQKDQKTARTQPAPAPPQPIPAAPEHPGIQPHMQGQGAQVPARKQRDAARPGEPADQQGQQHRGNRKRGEPVPTPPSEPT